MINPLLSCPFILQFSIEVAIKNIGIIELSFILSSDAVDTELGKYSSRDKKNQQ